MRRFIVVVVLWIAALQGAMANSVECPPPPEAYSRELFLAAKEYAKDRGLLWRVSKAGHTSYLYGTLHVGYSHWMAPGPQLLQVLKEVDVVALELNPLDAAVQRDMAAGLAAVPLRPLDATLRGRLRQQMELQCQPAHTLDSTPAELQVLALTVGVGQRDGLYSLYASEMLIALLAQNLQREIISLETPKMQLDVLLARDDSEARRAVDEGLEDLESGKVLRVLRRTVQMWESSNLDALERYAQWCECGDTEHEAEQMRALVDERNPAMVSQLDRLHGQGKRVLVAVGSLHMVGPQGLIAALSRLGYLVERLH